MDMSILSRAELEAYATACSASPLGILSGPAIRHELAPLSGPVDIIAVDWRKLHEWNDLLGYDVSNVFLAEFAQTRLGTERRRLLRFAPARRPARIDIRGQWGGDELLFAVNAGDGVGFLMRLVSALDTLSARLSEAQRQSIQEKTGGLIDGFAVAAVLIASSTDAYHWDNRGQDAGDASRAVAECGKLKAGVATGERATSGAAGTIIGTLPTC